jgi:hypothetical protein
MKENEGEKEYLHSAKDIQKRECSQGYFSGERGGRGYFKKNKGYEAG